MIKKFFKKNRFLLLLLIFSLLLRMAYQMVWLEDWDSVQFAMALHQYDLGQNLPHAPGYPLYILLGKIFFLLTQNDTLALVSLSLLSGTISIFLFYLIVKDLFPRNPKSALIGTLIFSLAPIHLVMSTTALTNIVGLASFLLFVYVIIKHGSRKPFLVGFIGGFILGVRATEALSILLLLLTHHWLKKQKFQNLLKPLLGLGTGVAAWLIPLFLIAGPENFLSAYGWISSYVVQHDSILNQQNRFASLTFLLKTAYGWAFLLLALAGLVLIILKKIQVKRYLKVILLVWLFSYLIPQALIFNLEVPRYTLPLLPPLALLFTFSISWLEEKNTTIAFLVLIFVSALTLQRGFSQLQRLKISLSPTIAPVKYVQENYSPSEVFLTTTFTYRQFQYYAPEFNSASGQFPTREELVNKKYFITDSQSLKNKFLAEDYGEIKEEKQFAGDLDIYSRIPKLSLYTLIIK